MKDLDVAAFMKAEREGGDADAAGQADVLARLEVTLGLPPPGGGPAGGGGGTGGGGGAPAGALLSGGALAKIGALLLAGFVAGAAVHAAITRSPEVAAPQVAPTLPLPIAPVTPPPVAPSAELATVALSDLPDAPTAAPPPSSARTDDSRRSDLDAERTLLETARTALVRGDGEHALAALERHRARFPAAGQLREERESLVVYALVAANRKDEARTKAAEFRRNFPRSLQGPALDALVGAP